MTKQKNNKSEKNGPKLPFQTIFKNQEIKGEYMGAKKTKNI